VQGAAPGADEEMRVVREERPGVDGEGAVRRQGRQPRDEVRAVRVVAEDGPALEAPHHHLVEGLVILIILRASPIIILIILRASPITLAFWKPEKSTFARAKAMPVACS